MSLVDQDFEMYQGETKQITFAIVDEDGDPLSLTGGTPEWYMLADPKDAVGSALVTKTGGNISLVDVDGTDDGVRLTIDPSDTASVVAGVHYHECRVTDASSREAIVAIGRVRLFDSPSA